MLVTPNSNRVGIATYANDALGADELDEVVDNRTLGVALGIRVDVAEVTDVAVLVPGGAVRLAVGVDCGGGPCQHARAPGI